MTAGMFVSVEGIDGAGKSRAAAELTGHLAALGAPGVLLDRHTLPGFVDGYAVSHLVRLARLIWDYPPPVRTSEFGAGHWHHLLAAWFHGVGELAVRPALAAGNVVVADSWYHKYAARFAVMIGIEEALDLFGGVPEPDLVLWLDAAPRVCLARRGVFKGTEQGEWLGLDNKAAGFAIYQRQVRHALATMRSRPDWQVCRASQWPQVRAWLADRANQIVGEKPDDQDG